MVAIGALLGTIAVATTSVGAPAVTLPNLSLPSTVVTHVEGNSGVSNATLTVTLSATSASTVTVNYITVDGSAKVSDADYQAASGTLTFAPGTTTRPISVGVIGDTKVEGYQTFTVKITGPTNATLGHSSEVVSILNDDAPALSVSGAKAAEGSPEIFKAHVTAAYYQAITLNAQTISGTAVSPGDFTALNTSVTFPAGSTAVVPISVATIDDTIPELAETFSLSVTGAGVIAGKTAKATIAASDGAQPIVSLPTTVLNKVEGNSGASAATLTVSLNQAPVTTVTVDYATANGSATLTDNDYVPASGTVSFAPGVTSRPISVLVNGDTKLEDYETLKVKLSNPTNATLGNYQETVTILNDDKPKLSVSKVTVAEGQVAAFVPKISKRYYQAITLSTVTADGTAVAPGDYTPVNGSITIAAGTTSGAVAVSTVSDTVPELAESFTLTLSGTDVLAPVTAVGTISASAGTVCVGATAPATYAHVLVVVGENRTWSGVGGAGFTSMPFMHGLAAGCAYYPTWSETNLSQNSLTQYIGLTSGIDNPATVDDCDPSATCRSTDPNIFRQVREMGTVRSYVEGATTGCSAAGNAAKHVPELYYFGNYTDGTGAHNDSDFCNTEVRPLTELNPNALPTFAFVTPTLCHDGHDCANSSVDAFMNSFLTPILASANYQAGNTAVIVIYDEDSPVPNLLMSKSAHAGPISGGGSHADLLLTIEQMLGLPTMSQGQLLTATSLRSGSGL